MASIFATTAQYDCCVLLGAILYPSVHFDRIQRLLELELSTSFHKKIEPVNHLIFPDEFTVMVAVSRPKVRSNSVAHAPRVPYLYSL